MALADPRTIFGVHTFAPYNRNTNLFYGIGRVVGSSSLSLTGELIKLTGGSFKYPWAIEEGLIAAELSLKFKEYADWMFELFLGKAPTAVGADTAGAVSTPVDKNGATVMDAVTGVATVIVIPTTGAANLKFGKYVLKATGAAALSLYVSTNIDFARGTDEDYDDDLLLVQSAITITTGANTDLATLGLRLTGGSGTIAFVTGDTATFQVLPPSTKSMTVRIGSVSDVFPEFGAMFYAKKKGNLEMFEIDAFRVKAAGLPIGFNENAWSEADVKGECFYDSSKDGVMDIRTLIESS